MIHAPRCLKGSASAVWPQLLQTIKAEGYGPRFFVELADEAQEVQPKGKTGRGDITLSFINKLYCIERVLTDGSDEGRKLTRQSRNQPLLAQLET